MDDDFHSGFDDGFEYNEIDGIICKGNVDMLRSDY